MHITSGVVWQNACLVLAIPVIIFFIYFNMEIIPGTFGKTRTTVGFFHGYHPLFVLSRLIFPNLIAAPYKEPLALNRK